jgi:hypothetical protein
MDWRNLIWYYDRRIFPQFREALPGILKEDSPGYTSRYIPAKWRLSMIEVIELLVNVMVEKCKEN